MKAKAKNMNFRMKKKRMSINYKHDFYFAISKAFEIPQLQKYKSDNIHLMIVGEKESIRKLTTVNDDYLYNLGKADSQYIDEFGLTCDFYVCDSFEKLVTNTKILVYVIDDKNIISYFALKIDYDVRRRKRTYGKEHQNESTA